MPLHPMMPSGLTGQVPVASVVAYAGIIPPVPEGAEVAPGPIEQTGWMPCDGRTLRVATYPELFICIGYTYGGEGEFFAIPDYRDVTAGLPSISYLIKFTYGAPRMGSAF